MNYTKRQELNLLMAQLELERSSFDAHWRDLGDHILPRRIRFDRTDANRGDKRNQLIVDSTATVATTVARAGMMGGITSPARPWFRLSSTDPSLDESQGVRTWLDDVTVRMRSFFLKTNLYQALPQVYQDLLVFGTACLYVEEDGEDGLRFFTFPAGSYYLANDHRLKVSVFAREYRMTVRQLVDHFGEKDSAGNILNWENFSLHVKQLYEEARQETWIDVTHVIRPNPEWNPDKLGAKYKRWESCYFETGSAGTTSYLTDADENRYLRESGYDRFPILAPRWETTGEDVYGTNCPGMIALGDIRQLQKQEKRISQAIEKMVNPPMKGPSTLRGSKVSTLPGDLTLLDARAAQGDLLSPVYQINPSIKDLEYKQEQIRRRIHDVFLTNMFMMLSADRDRQKTAREVEELHQEKMLMLGPVLEQLNQDLLDPLIDIAFESMLKRGEIPEPPEELEGMNLDVEYISIMATAQRMVGINTLNQFTQYAGMVAQVDPAVLDKIDRDQLIDEMGMMTGIPSSVVRDDDAVEEIRAARQQQQAMAQQMAMQQAGAETAKTLASADTSGKNALTDLVNAAQAHAIA